MTLPSRPDTEPSRITNVLVAADVDDGPADAVDVALDLAAQLGARVVVLHVIPTPPSVDADVFLHPAAHPAATVQLRESERRVAVPLRDIARRASRIGVPVSLRVAHGNVADAILLVARDLAVDMIVLGTHGRRGLARAVLGSVAESVVRQSAVPVLTVRGRPADPSTHPTHRELPLDDSSHPTGD